MKKAFDQTVRDLKRGVNKKVLKVPGIEQKVLDATSNEPWGPHGSHLADIAQASRNYHEYQMIMAVLWKRINDTGKNWRHVYKALTILEYLVAHGSERVIDEIREHAYQISTLSDFQYIDSSGKDQGGNVRRKSQSLVVLVNDKERILEARNKAIANREKFRNTSSTGGMYRPNSYSSSGGYGDRYDDGRYGNRDDDQNGYGREREKEWGYRDDDRYGRGGDSSNRDGDRYGRDSDERYGRDDYKDDDYRERSRNIDDHQYGSRSRSSDRYKDRAFDDDDRYSSRSSGARVEDHSQDERRLERKFSEQNIGAPPSYEEVVRDAQSPVQDERDGEIAGAPIPKASSPPKNTSQGPVTVGVGTIASPENQEFEAFDEFDPRGSVPAAPPTANGGQMDLFGSLSESFSSNSLALVPVTSVTTSSEADAPINSASGPTFVALSSASTVLNQPFEDPFGDSPFKAILTPDNIPAHQPQNFASTSNFQPTSISQSSEPIQPVVPKMETISSFDFGDTFPGITYNPSSVTNSQVPSVNTQFSPPDQNFDILANILPPSGPTAPIPSQAAFPAPTGPLAQPSSNVHGNFLPQSGFTTPEASQAALQPPTVPTGPPVQPAFPAPTGPFALSSNNVPGNFLPPSGYAAPVASQVVLQAPTVPPVQQYSDGLGNLLPQMGLTAPAASQAALPAPTGLSAKAQPPKDKFETKSTVWTDTLNRGLVNLNISGPKINPLADIGIDFDSINRKEKREKPVATTVTSTVTMGKAMGSGSGIGRAGASVLAPPPNTMMGSGMAMGSYGGMNQPMGMGMGMNMGVGMNMGMGQVVQMRPPTGLPPGQTMPGGYNPMMGTGAYPPQQPYGGYR